MLLPLLLLSIDPSPTSHTYDWICTKELLQIDKFLPARIRQELVPDDAIENDACAISCVHCADGVIQSVVWRAKEREPFDNLYVDLDWLPPTTLDVHLRTCDLVDALNTARLPRRLSYLHLEDVRMTNFRPFAPINLRTLPGQMEELHMMNCALTGTIDVTQLPKTMTHLSFCHAWVREMVLLYNLLPAGLDYIAVLSYDNSFQVAGDQARDKRIIIGYVPIEVRQTPRYFKYLNSE